ncbi:MAG TPA: hypothetical protein VJ804_01250 [Acidimicrobiales bacterium]|nr:hypothetical protein [Acidimicrobiales bacterium]
MTLRFVRLTVATLLLVGTAACGLPGGGNGSPCDDPADDEPTTFAVSSGSVSDPDVLEGCVDSESDSDTFDLTRPATGTGTYNIQCFAAEGVAEFDTPISTGFVPCTPGGSTVFSHNEVTTADIVVQAQDGSTGGEYRLDLVVA